MNRLAIIIVSYNTRSLLRACLASIKAATAASNGSLSVEVLVIDNASEDGSAAMVATDYPNVRLTPLSENIGFTCGNNLALAQLGFDPRPRSASSTHGASSSLAPDHPDYVLLLNPDTVLRRDTLTQLVDFMELTPAAGACGPALSYGTGEFQHAAFRFPGLFQIWLDLFPLHGVAGAQRLRNSRFNGRYDDALWQDRVPFPVDFVLGASMFVRSATIRQIGGLDEGYFMYCEEMDWALRMQEAGWGVYIVPWVNVTHFEGQSSRQVRWPAFVELWRSRLRFYGKHADRYPLWYLWLVRGLLRSGLAWRSRAIRRAFASGEVSGEAAGDALDAYRTVQQL